MSNYELSLTAGEIDIALQKAHDPDTSPQATDNLVTSGGVKTYVDAVAAALSSADVDLTDLLVPPPLNFDFFSYYPVPHTQGTMTFYYTHANTLNTANTTFTYSIDVYNSFGTLVSSAPITHTITFSGDKNDVLSGSFTGTFNINSTGLFKLVSNSPTGTQTDDNGESTPRATLTLISSNPSAL